MDRRHTIFDAIESRDAARFIEILDKAFKQATREASFRSHALGLNVADGRAEEDRQPKPVTSLPKRP